MAQKSLTKSQYSKKYLDARGHLLSSRLELAVAGILEFLGVDYKYAEEVQLNGAIHRVDFFTPKGIIEVVERDAEFRSLAKKVSLLRESKKQVLVVSLPSAVDQLESMGIPSVTLGHQFRPDTRLVKTIFMEDSSFNFDYSHILPTTPKCSVLHGHTSTVALELSGRAEGGMLVDFGRVKDMVRSCLRSMDHKLFISRKYIVSEDEANCRIKFTSNHGQFDLSVPKSSIFMLEGEATSENLAEILVSRLAPLMPKNVDAIAVRIYEGLNKGSRLVAATR